MLRSLAELVQQHGVAPEVLFGESTPLLYAEQAALRLTVKQLEPFFTRAIELTNDPAFGLHCGLLASEASFGLLSPLVSHASTLRHGLATILQFYPLLLEDPGMRLEQDGEVARLHFAFDAPPSRSVVEFFVSGTLRTLRFFGCRQQDIRGVFFAYSRPSYHRAYATAFAGAERFRRAFSGVEFSAAALDRPHLHRQADLQQTLRGEAELKLKRLECSRTCTQRVKTLIEQRARADLPDMVSAARELGLSVRSLRRQLDEEGSSYRNLTQAVLRERACTSLRNPTRTLQAISHSLGFSDVASFHRAFRRWCGQTPAEYRASLLDTK